MQTWSWNWARLNQQCGGKLESGNFLRISIVTAGVQLTCLLSSILLIFKQQQQQEKNARKTRKIQEFKKTDAWKHCQFYKKKKTEKVCFFCFVFLEQTQKQNRAQLCTNQQTRNSVFLLFFLICVFVYSRRQKLCVALSIDLRLWLAQTSFFLFLSLSLFFSLSIWKCLQSLALCLINCIALLLLQQFQSTSLINNNNKTTTLKKRLTKKCKKNPE